MQSPSKLPRLIAAAAILFAQAPGLARPQTPAASPAPATSSAAHETAAMASRVQAIWPAGVVQHVGHPGSWGYEAGVPLDGMAAEWSVTHESALLAYIRAAVDRFVGPDGAIAMDGRDHPARPFPSAEHTLDDLELGRSVLFLYTVTHDERYAQAARFLRRQLADQPRTPSGGFWHKQIYPNQMWLDGAYMAGPFLAAYGAIFHQPADFDEAVRQIFLMDAHMRDPATGLLRHGWDETRKMPWADPATGLSPEAWARADGWYVLALVDLLDWMPAAHPQRAALIDDLKRTMAAILRVQDPATGLWWQVLDKGGSPGNYLEASASCMFVAALAKGVRLGYLPPRDAAAARRGWQGIQTRFIKQGPDGPVLTGTVRVGGLGGTPYRAGDYAYYVHETVQDDDPKGVGAYLMAGAQLQLLQSRQSQTPHSPPPDPARTSRP